MELFETSESINNYIRECNRIIHNKGHGIAKSYGLTHDQYHLLVYLYLNNHRPTISEISKNFRRAQNTISEKISRLEDRGLIERVRDLNDRRVIRVKLSLEGLKLISAIRKEKDHKITYLALKNMNQLDVECLLNNLSILYNYLKKGD